MGPDKLKSQIGAIVTNLQSLEFALRLFLYESVGPQDEALKLEQLAVDDWVPETPLTNYDTLTDLVRRVNTRLNDLGISERVDDSLVAIRDALAHGRTFSLAPSGPFTLLKFSKSKQGKVQVTTALELSPAWLKEQTESTFDEIQKVVRIGQSLGLRCFPMQ